MSNQAVAFAVAFSVHTQAALIPHNTANQSLISSDSISFVSTAFDISLRFDFGSRRVQPLRANP